MTQRLIKGERILQLGLMTFANKDKLVWMGLFEAANQVPGRRIC